MNLDKKTLLICILVSLVAVLTLVTLQERLSIFDSSDYVTLDVTMTEKDYRPERNWTVTRITVTNPNPFQVKATFYWIDDSADDHKAYFTFGSCNDFGNHEFIINAKNLVSFRYEAEHV